MTHFINRDSKLKVQSAGYTLIELMVVIAIMGLVTSFVLPYIPSDKADRMRHVADEFEALVSYAQTHAVLQSQDLGLLINEDDYSFVRLASGTWKAVTEEALSPQPLDSYLNHTLFVEGVSVVIDPNEAIVPSVLLFSSGEVTPFEYQLSLSDQQFVRFKYNLLGDVEREYVNESQ